MKIDVMNKEQLQAKGRKLRKVLYDAFRILVLAAAVLLILIITHDTFDDISFIVDPKYIRLQFWICLTFMADIVAETILGPKNWRTISAEVVFFLICLPYINIIDHFDIHVSGELLFLLRSLPMLRAIYIVVQLTRTIDSNFITNMFRAYISLFIVLVYLSSLMFFVEEHAVNKDVDTYWSALWWTVMTLTTAGCYINEVTTVGKILSVVLSAGGLILFPVFTVYISDAMSGDSANNNDKSEKSANFADNKTTT